MASLHSQLLVISFVHWHSKCQICKGPPPHYPSDLLYQTSSFSHQLAMCMQICDSKLHTCMLCNNGGNSLVVMTHDLRYPPFCTYMHTPHTTHHTHHTHHTQHTSAAEHITPDAPAAADMADSLESLCLLQPSQGTGRHHPALPVPARVRASLIPIPHSSVQPQSQVLVLQHSRSCIWSRLPSQIP